MTIRKFVIAAVTVGMALPAFAQETDCSDPANAELEECLPPALLDAQNFAPIAAGILGVAALAALAGGGSTTSTSTTSTNGN